MQITRPTVPAGPLGRADFQTMFDQLMVALDDADQAGIQTALQTAFGTALNGVNYLLNPDFRTWSNGTAAVALPEDAWTERADRWMARANYAGLGGSTATYQRGAVSSSYQQFLDSALLTGGLNCAYLDFGQELSAARATNLHPTATLTIELENNTGASVTPQLRLDTCNSFENYAAVTNRVAQDFPSAIAHGERKTWTITVDLSLYGAALRNGALLYVRLTGLTANTKTFTVYPAKLEKGATATARVTERDPYVPTSSAATNPTNFLRNGNFNRWLNTSTTAPEDVDTYAPEAWFVLPSDGTTLALAREAVTPDDRNLYALKLTGDVAVSGTVDVGQNILQSLASDAYQPLVFGAYLYNNTGAVLTPSFRVDTCNTANVFTTVTNRINAALDDIPAGSWAFVQYPFDASALTDFRNGARIYLRFASGTLNLNTKYIRVAQGLLRTGTDATGAHPQVELEPPTAPNGSYGSLLITCPTSSTVTATATDLVLKRADGSAILIPSFSATAATNFGAGANGLDYGAVTVAAWHYIWAISRGDTHALLLSQSATAPTLPAGYTYRALLGDVLCGAGTGVTNNKIRQNGKQVWCARSTTTPTFAAINTYYSQTLAVSPRATSVRGFVGTQDATDLRVVMSADGLSGTPNGVRNIILADSAAADLDGYYASEGFELPIITPQTIYIRASSTSIDLRLNVTAWMLP